MVRSSTSHVGAVTYSGVEEDMTSRLQMNDGWLLMKRRSRVWLGNAEDVGATEIQRVKTLFVLIALCNFLVVSGILTHACSDFTFSDPTVVSPPLYVRRGHLMIYLPVRAH
jgi:hypothetical protein